MAKRMINDIERIKASLDAVTVVERFGQCEARKKVRCPNHAHPQTGKTPPCRMDYQTGLWACHCGAQGDLLDFIGYCLYVDYDHRTRPHFAQLIDQLAGLQITPMPAEERARRTALHQSAAKLTLDPSRLGEWFKNLQCEPELLAWLKARGVKNPEQHQLGYTSLDASLNPWEQHKITIPHFYRGVLTGVKLRHDPRLKLAEGKDKYISLKGGHYPAPFGADALHMPVDCAYVIETELDALALREMGLGAVIALPARNFTKTTASLFMMVPQVVVILDNDEAGVTGGKEIKRLLPRAELVSPPEGFKDFGEWYGEFRTFPKWIKGE
jgi:hypothetical protein